MKGINKLVMPTTSETSRTRPCHCSPIARGYVAYVVLDIANSLAASHFTRASGARPRPAAVKHHPGRGVGQINSAELTLHLLCERFHVDRRLIGLSKVPNKARSFAMYHTGTLLALKNLFGRGAQECPCIEITLKYVIYSTDPLDCVVAQAFFCPCCPSLPMLEKEATQSYRQKDCTMRSKVQGTTKR